METLQSHYKQACWIHLQLWIYRYLMSNAEGRWNGANKAECHKVLCEFYVAVARGVDEGQVRGVHEEDYRAVHTKTQELTDNMDEMIGFPIKGEPDYDLLAPLFFEKFHHLALQALAERP